MLLRLRFEISRDAQQFPAKVRGGVYAGVSNRQTRSQDFFEVRNDGCRSSARGAWSRTETDLTVAEAMRQKHKLALSTEHTEKNDMHLHV